MVLIYISLVAKDVEYFIKYFTAFLIFFVENSLFRFESHFVMGLSRVLMHSFLNFLIYVG